MCRKLDNQIIILLKQRFKDCMMYERFEREKCRELLPAIEEAKVNFFIKCNYSYSLTQTPSSQNNIKYPSKTVNLAGPLRHIAILCDHL